MKNPATRLTTSASAVERVSRWEKKAPSRSCGIRSRIQEFQPQWEIAENDA
ncbi:hypothetical protein [Methanoculleus chikugoensis]|uniref:hypothetical protein n=1 Tax=Methanoculleus chikugoensis TaxID=118126 RepID=UPI001FB40733|nr:hypothetical protein [Methanoculleus chikugoensis]